MRGAREGNEEMFLTLVLLVFTASGFNFHTLVCSFVLFPLNLALFHFSFAFRGLPTWLRAGAESGKASSP